MLVAAGNTAFTEIRTRYYGRRALGAAGTTVFLETRIGRRAPGAAGTTVFLETRIRYDGRRAPAAAGTTVFTEIRTRSYGRRAPMAAGNTVCTDMDRYCGATKLMCLKLPSGFLNLKFLNPVGTWSIDVPCSGS